MAQPNQTTADWFDFCDQVVRKTLANAGDVLVALEQFFTDELEPMEVEEMVDEDRESEESKDGGGESEESKDGEGATEKDGESGLYGDGEADEVHGFKTHLMNDDLVCLRCGLLMPGNQLCNS